ncbi:Sec13-like protein [Cavenderia fasciculata]|uniref:Sec13-like protein n=1 Tax=Cavenderia fasciculata TaxID=261658 RepID=F4Q0F0_CACFS|nr:Sec13-like protein [Cavenderia fasciculata]EGG18301.1 Sec13-like protein [Cavenderia fasciculata]|eukprot:XP_004357124.1 Sec13-like protein [Cavenderia fasciculata]
MFGLSPHFECEVSETTEIDKYLKIAQKYEIRVFHRFSTSHDDLIHDVSYDFYGKRLATCSSDQKIKVWDMNDSGKWELSAEWKAHSGSVWKVAWTHPEFGQVLASCSFDRTVCIWEEGEDEKGQKKWNLKATLVDSRDSVTDIKFSPKSFGLRLATSSCDGLVLSSGHHHHHGHHHTGSTSSSSMSSDPSESPKTIHDVSWAPNMGRSYHLIAAASKDHNVRIWKVSNNEKSKMEIKEVLCNPLHKAEVWRVEWNITGTILASSGDDGNVFLWKCNNNGEWKLLSSISGEEETDPLMK